MKNLTSYLEEYALISLEKQDKLARLIGEHAVELDIEAGTIRFSGNIEFPTQVLGTQSDNTLTWLWAWAEEQPEIPVDLQRSSLQLKAWGAKAGINEFSVPSVDLDDADGQAISLIASEVCKASCYYQDTYEGGALFLLLFGKEIDRQPSFDVAGLIRHFSHLISFYELNHRNALLSYFRLKGLSYAEQGPVIAGELESGEDIRVKFDLKGSAISINDKALPLD